MSIGEYEETEGKKESACRSGGGGSCGSREKCVADVADVRYVKYIQR